MSDTYQRSQPERINGTPPPDAGKSFAANDTGKTLLVGLLGGIISAAGYIVYQRLPDDQRQRLHSQVRSILDERLSEIKANFNL